MADIVPQKNGAAQKNPGVRSCGGPGNVVFEAAQRPSIEMNLHRVFACLGGLMALALAWFVYTEYIYFLGFPDGYVTEQGAAERKLAVVFIAVSVPVGAYLLYLGWIATRRKVGKGLAIIIALYLFFLFGVLLVDAYYHVHLPGGSGG